MINNNLLARLSHNALKCQVASRHSAAILKGNTKVIAMGYNNHRTCFSGHPTCGQHAESSAIFELLMLHSARHYLKMLPSGKWCFLRTNTTSQETKEVQDGCYSVK
jgi:hypothetical protein